MHRLCAVVYDPTRNQSALSPSGWVEAAFALIASPVLEERLNNSAAALSTIDTENRFACGEIWISLGKADQVRP